MKPGSRRAILAALPFVYLLGVTLAKSQAAPEQKPQMADEVFKNVQVLRGLTVNEFMGTMGFIAASLSMNCIDCHVTASASDVTKFADDTPLKQTARKMILMVKTINAANFGGKRTVTCYSCHRGADRPKGIPSLADQYGTPPPEDPDEAEIVGPPPAGRHPPAKFSTSTYRRWAGHSGWPASRALWPRALTKVSTPVMKKFRWKSSRKLPLSARRSFISPKATASGPTMAVALG